ncbi:hypothetical protein WICPIJ_006559 [Wickerhamomyces pijperi]|uniref:Sugar phosphate transporter domain-containing protein n=1 Tax=Wickerhamomyces pijperi TaxID=599730 RepID=A0A9P8Q1U0_WICPI|nr:hypothetical protein WICPIJ_006559 [Wickerhamomyces pijperi]
MASSYYIPALALSLIATGCANSIFTKYQDQQTVPSGGTFTQPVLQTLQMFIGESCALLFFYFQFKLYSTPEYDRLTPSPLSDGKPPITRRATYLLAIPAACDLAGTTMMNLGLIYTPVSIYQMIRGALILFVALFSVVFLRRKISRVEWLSLFIVVIGITIVGLSGKKSQEKKDDSAFELIFGIMLILLGQIFTASQFVVEEHILSKFTIEPLKLVGYEGSFGVALTFAGMIILYVLLGVNNKGPFDMVNSFEEMFSNSAILYSSIAIMISICSFNFFGVTITSKLSATARSTIDTCRTMLVWFVSLALGWETFSAIQLSGFACLVFGTLVFNGAIEVQEGWLPAWFFEDQLAKVHVVDTLIDEQIERS